MIYILPFFPGVNKWYNLYSVMIIKNDILKIYSGDYPRIERWGIRRMLLALVSCIFAGLPYFSSGARLGHEGMAEFTFSRDGPFLFDLFSFFFVFYNNFKLVNSAITFFRKSSDPRGIVSFSIWHFHFRFNIFSRFYIS